jgi:hypothetical protein
MLAIAGVKGFISEQIHAIPQMAVEVAHKLFSARNMYTVLAPESPERHA